MNGDKRQARARLLALLLRFLASPRCSVNDSLLDLALTEDATAGSISVIAQLSAPFDGLSWYEALSDKKSRKSNCVCLQTFGEHHLEEGLHLTDCSLQPQLPCCLAKPTSPDLVAFYEYACYLFGGI